MITIEETLKIEIPELASQDYTDQADDFRMQRLREGLTQFVYRFAATHTNSPGEEAVLTLAIARAIFEGVNSQAAADLLRERLHAHADPTPRNERGRCAACNGGGVLSGGAYCACYLGVDLAKLAQRKEPGA
jgi:hypothetical protein